MDKWSEQSETVTIIVPITKAKQLQSFLNSKGKDKIGTIETFTAIFDNDVEVDIKVCQGNPPFVDAVLFIDRCEAGSLDVIDTLLGEYIFGNRTVILKSEVTDGTN